MEETTMVPGESKGDVVDTTVSGEVAAQTATTLTTTSEDAEKAALVAKVQAEYEEKLARTNQDLNQLKSTFQRNEAKLQREWQQREANYQRELEEARVANMDDEQRKAYESTSASRRAIELESQLEETQQQANQLKAILEAKDWFLDRGVPREVLGIENGYEVLWNNGMNWIADELKKARSTPTASPPSTPTVLPKQAPPVVTASGTPAYSGTNWPDLIKEFGSEENVYRLVETGQLSPDILPKPRGV